MRKRQATVVISSSTVRPVAGGFNTRFVSWQPLFIFNEPIVIVAMLFQSELAPRPVLDRALVFISSGWVFLSLS